MSAVVERRWGLIVRGRSMSQGGAPARRDFERLTKEGQAPRGNANTRDLLAVCSEPVPFCFILGSAVAKAGRGKPRERGCGFFGAVGFPGINAAARKRRRVVNDPQRFRSVACLFFVVRWLKPSRRKGDAWRVRPLGAILSMSRLGIPHVVSEWPATGRRKIGALPVSTHESPPQIRGRNRPVCRM